MTVIWEFSISPSTEELRSLKEKVLLRRELVPKDLDINHSQACKCNNPIPSLYLWPVSREATKEKKTFLTIAICRTVVNYVKYLVLLSGQHDQITGISFSVILQSVREYLCELLSVIQKDFQ